MSHGGKRKGAGRHPTPEPRIVRVNLHLTRAEAKAIDKARGTKPRPDFIRAAALAAARANEEEE